MSKAATIAVLLLCSTAGARPKGEDFEKELAALDKSLANPAPGAGLERAAAGARWCQGIKSSEEAWPKQIGDRLEEYRNNHEAKDLIEVALHACSVDDPVYRRAATETLQYWINETGLSQADAIASLTARLDHDAWSAEQEKLCKAIANRGNSASEPGALGETREQLFGCDDPEHAVHAAWMNTKGAILSNFTPFLDRGVIEREHDELARIAWVDAEVQQMLDPNADANVLANYATTQFDLKALAYDAALKQLDAPPYRGNRYARIVGLETIGRTKLIVAQLETAVAKRTKDQRWKALLITAPEAASAAWVAAAQKHKDVLARSEKIAASVVAKDDAAAGCAAALRPDLLAYLKALPHATMHQLEDSVSDDPLAGWLLRSYRLCLEYTDHNSIWKATADFSMRVTRVGGPRQAAYLAVVRAGAAMKPEPPFRPYYAMHAMQEGDQGDVGGGDSTISRGVIASLDKKKDGSIKVTFVKERFQYMAQECKETSKIDRIEKDGSVVYRRECHDAGKAWADKAPEPITVPANCTVGLAKGRFVYPEFEIPMQIYADKTAKKLLAAHCLSLE